MNRVSVGTSIPNATLLRLGSDRPEQVRLHDLTAGRKVVLVGLPGPFTGTCTEAHVPSFMRVRDALSAAGVESVVCFAVCDPFVMKAWSMHTGAEEAGLTMLADSAGELTKALGLDFDAPVVGFYGRTTRHAMFVDDNVVTILHFEKTHGVCDLTAGESMLEAIHALDG